MLFNEKRHLALTSNSFAASKAFWERHFARLEKEGLLATHVPLESVPNKVLSKELVVIQRTLHNDLADTILRICGGSEINCFSLLLTVLSYLLKVYNSVTEGIVLGVPAQPLPSPLALDYPLLKFGVLFQKDWTFRICLEKVKEQLIELYDHQDFPFDLLEKKDAESLKIAAWYGQGVVDDVFPQNIDIGCSFEPPTAAGLVVSIVYTEGRYLKRDLSDFLYYFEILTQRVLEHPNIPLRQIRLTAEDFQESFKQANYRDEILPDFGGGTFVGDDGTDSIGNPEHFLRLWQSSVSRFGSHTAVKDSTGRYSYETIDRLSDSIGKYLRSKGVDQSGYVALLLDPSVAMVSTIIACFKCGIPYIPIDIRAPEHRIRSMLMAFPGIQVVVKGAGFLFLKHDFNLIDANGFGVGPSHDFQYKIAGPETPAYIIHTSGSTGRPKAVIIKHVSLFNYTTWLCQNHHIGPTDATVLTASFAFDLGYTSIYPTLASGGCLHLLDSRYYLDQQHMLSYIRTNQITFLKGTPSYLLALFGAFPDLAHYGGSLRLVISGGESMNFELLHLLFNTFGESIEVLNHYGPTETTIGVLTELIQASNYKEFIEQPVIGRPIAHVQVAVLDENLNHLPPGIKGYLWVMGKSLFQGYYGQDVQESLKTIPLPDGSVALAYYTGDIASWSDDMKIRFWGRRDAQVKLHGYRLDLREVESAVLRFPSMVQASVQIIESQSQSRQLTCFYYSKRPVTKMELTEFLKKQLPAYMVPSDFIFVEEFSLTANGKLDTKRLSQAYSKGSFPERSEVLAGIWAEVLGKAREAINGRSDFFENGGHSLMIFDLISRVRKQLGKDVKISDVYRHSVLYNFAEHVDKLPNIKVVECPAISVHPYYRCTPFQRRLFLLQKADTTGILYNKPLILKISGDLDIDRFLCAIQQLVDRHEILRTSFQYIDDELYQKVEAHVTIPVKTYNHFSEQLLPTLSTLVRPFHLPSAPLFRLSIFKVTPTKHIVFFDMHHITSDAYSSNILLDDLFQLYEHKQLPDVERPYKGYSELLLSEDYQKRMEFQKEFWRNLLKPYEEAQVYRSRIFTAQVGVDHHVDTTSKTVRFVIRGVQYFKICDLIKFHGASLFTFMLSCFCIVVHHRTGLKGLLIGTSVDNRHAYGMGKAVGLFMNTMLVPVLINPHESFKEFLKRFCLEFSDMLDNAECSFDEVVETMRSENNHEVYHPEIFFEQLPPLSDLRKVDGLSIEAMPLNEGPTKFPISVYLTDNHTELTVEVEYDAQLFQWGLMDAICTHFQQVITTCVETPNILMAQIGN